MELDEILGLLDDLDDPGSVYLNDWEVNFIDSIMEQIDDGHGLTTTQIDKLKEIHEKRAK